jgi:hypothetical protein
MTLKLPNINSKFVKDNLVTLILAALLLYCFMSKRNPLEMVKESFSDLLPSSSDPKQLDNKDAEGPGPSASENGPAPVVSTVKAHDEEEVEYGQVGALEQNMNIPSCAHFVSSNLLPKDDPKLDENFTEFSPAKDLEGQDFIDTNKYAIGMQSQTLRNANHQLRSDPPIANTMECSSPWNNSTISAEARRPLTIGSTA